MSINAVGSPWTETGTNSIAVAPSAVGDILVLFLADLGVLQSVSGGGVTSWTVGGNSNTGGGVAWGVVTATGNATLTWTSSNPSTENYSNAQVVQFHSTNPSAQWAMNPNSAYLSGTSTASTGTFFTPTAPVGGGLLLLSAATANTSLSGTGAGFTFLTAPGAYPPTSLLGAYQTNVAGGTTPTPGWSMSGANAISAAAIMLTDYSSASSSVVASFSGSIVETETAPTSVALSAAFSGSISTSGGFAPTNEVPWMLPVAINDHAYVMDFLKSRITTMQIRRQASDASVEPGEQTLSAAGVWPRAQDNYFLGAGQEFLDNRFAFESVYVHSGEYPSVRTRFWKSQGVNPWHEGKMSLLNEYASIATSTVNLLIIACGSYLYRTDGANLYFTNNPVGVVNPTWTKVTTSNTNTVVSLATDGSRVWFACGSQGVYVTVAGTTTVASAATPATLPNIGGLLLYSAGAGTLGSYLAAGSVTYYVTKVDAFGNETTATSATITVGTTPVNINWQPDTNASKYNVYRGSTTLVYSGTDPSFVDDGTVQGSTRTAPVSNGTGSTAYQRRSSSTRKGTYLAQLVVTSWRYWRAEMSRLSTSMRTPPSYGRAQRNVLPRYLLAVTQAGRHSSARYNLTLQPTERHLARQRGRQR